MSAPLKSPNKGIQFFYHFPKNLLQPYGEATQGPDEHKIFYRLKPLNCEWLIRPKVTLSELAATVKGNFSLLAQIADNDNCELVENMAKHMSKTLDTIANFSNKETRQGTSRKDLKELMRFFISQDEEVESFVNKAIQEGNAIYTLGIQLKVAKVLFKNPDRYAHISVHPEGKDAELKKEPRLKTLFSYLEKTCLHPTDTGERSDGKRSLLAQFADLEESDDDNEPKPKWNKSKKKKSFPGNVF